MAETWVVLLEAERSGSGADMDREDAATLLAALRPGPYGRGLYCDDRYALQITARATGPAEALSSVLLKWEQAVRRLGLPRWRVVRTEVLTVAEFERDLDQADQVAGPSARPAPLASGLAHGDLAEELLRDALSDPVTGLLGPDAFEHLLRAALAVATGGPGVAVACVRLDLDGLEARLGPAGADQIRLSVARRLAATVRPDDALARVQEDVFAALLTDTRGDSALAVAGRMLDAVRRPLTLPGLEGGVTAWGGVAVGEPGEEVAMVLARADAAMTAARDAPDGGPVPFGSAAPGRRSGSGAPHDSLAHVPEEQARWWQRRQAPGRPPPHS